LQENHSGPILPNNIGVSRTLLLVGPKNRGAVGTETRSRRRKRRGRKGTGRGTPLQPTRGSGEAS